MDHIRVSECLPQTLWGPCTFWANDFTNKPYVVFFTCAVTGAVSLELVTDMSTKLYVCFLQIYVAERVMPRHLFG